ncbi:hypothetical protein P7C70_g1649, partial [Phenoliferia sp. Uapishka_3]
MGSKKRSRLGLSNARRPIRTSRLIGALFGVTTLWWVFGWKTHSPVVCLIGNSESSQRSIAVFEQWGRELPGVFYIWGSELNSSNPYEEQLGFIHTPGESLPFSDGLDLAKREAMKRYPCDYVFTHDDDLVFTLEPSLLRPGDVGQPLTGERLASRLKETLAVYKPAIASFAWDVGDSRWETMGNLKIAWKDSEVAPLGGFDNGMVIYHRDVLDFYFPFPPSGEGGFVGKWTLSAHFFMMFGSALFGENAIRINCISYVNSINLNNRDIPADMITYANGVATVPWTRHPYEWPLNEAYISFLKSGLRDRGLSYGFELTVEDAIPPKPRSGNGYSPSYVLDRVSRFYDPAHAALANNVMLSQFTPGQLRSRSSTDFNLRLILFTMNRIDSFERLWSSVEAALASHPPTVTVIIDIRVDWDRKAEEAARANIKASIIRMAGSRTEVTITFASEAWGLKKSVLESWKPSSNSEYAILLEDDIEVSPYFLQYSEAMVRAYVYRDRADHRLFAISLYALRFNEVLDKFVSVKNGNNPWIHQMPQSWGAVFLPEPWRQFLLWQREQQKYGIDPIIPDTNTNRWDHRQSWKKYMFRYMLLKGGYIIYPNLPGGASLSTNHVEKGTNHLTGAFTDANKALIDSKYVVPLWEGRSAEQAFESLPTLDTLQVFTMKHEKVASVDEFLINADHVGEFDKCTALVAIGENPTMLAPLLEHYTRVKGIGQILIFWNVDSPEPKEDVYNKLGIPTLFINVGTGQESIHERFRPRPEIMYSCIISITDKATLIPSVALNFAIAAWKGALYERMVGFRHYSRNHQNLPDPVSGRSVLYSPTALGPSNLWGKKPFASLVLTPLAIFHRRYLEKYTLPEYVEVRRRISQNWRCADLFLNELVSRESGAGPVVVDIGKDALLGLSDAQVRYGPAGKSSGGSECLSPGVSPLQYTTSFFTPTVDILSFIPGLLHHFYQPTIPIEFPCRLRDFNESGDCVLETDRWLYRDHPGPVPAFFSESLQ